MRRGVAGGCRREMSFCCLSRGYFERLKKGRHLFAHAFHSRDVKRSFACVDVSIEEAVESDPRTANGGEFRPGKVQAAPCVRAWQSSDDGIEMSAAGPQIEHVPDRAF